MKNTEVQMLIQLRQFAIEAYNQIEGAGNPMAQMRAQDGAYTLSSIIKSLDDVIKPYVQIKKEMKK